MLPRVREILESLVTPEPFESLVRCDFGHPLGDGRFGRVYRGEWIASGQGVAVKVPVCADFGQLTSTEMSVVNEVAVMKAVREAEAPHLMPLVAAFLEPLPFAVAKSVEGRRRPLTLLICMPLARGGDLFSRIADSSTVYNEEVAARYFRDILLALRALHSMKLVHRDMKPENLLLASEGASSRVILGDFGLTCPVGSREERFVGTAPYGAPESHSRRHEYSFASDVWSAGCILYSMLSGIPAFYPHGEGDKQEGMVRSILSGSYRFWDKYWKGVSDEAKDLVSRMLKRKPRDRISIEEALKHPW
jgi:serine/threonine protein kinase